MWFCLMRVVAGTLYDQPALAEGVEEVTCGICLSDIEAGHVLVVRPPVPVVDVQQGRQPGSSSVPVPTCFTGDAAWMMRRVVDAMAGSGP